MLTEILGEILIMKTIRTVLLCLCKNSPNLFGAWRAQIDNYEVLSDIYCDHVVEVHVPRAPFAPAVSQT